MPNHDEVFSPPGVSRALLRRIGFSCALLALFLQAGAASAGGLNDTGIDVCSRGYPNVYEYVSCVTVANAAASSMEDGNYGRDAQAARGQLTKVGAGSKGFDFTKIANNGSVLSASAALGSGATDWACTRDNVTGLMWEVKTTSGLRSQKQLFAWYNSNNATNGGYTGYPDGLGIIIYSGPPICFTKDRCDTEKYVQDVNATALCGVNDWRLPTVKELEGIVDFGSANPAIDLDYFPNTPSTGFWSSSPSAYQNYNVWTVEFTQGSSTLKPTAYNYPARLVRGTP